MGKSFDQKEVGNLLAQCHRRCCICHRFCGIKLETDHILPKSEGGTDDIENAILVCFECHAEIHSYNDKHPRGRKFRPEELKEHKKQWLEICKNKPEAFISSPWESDVGPLQAMIDELEFNERLSQKTDPKELGCLFLDNQFHKAINEGAISILVDELKNLIIEAYAAIGLSNQSILSALTQPLGNSRSTLKNSAQDNIRLSQEKIKKAKDELLTFLSGSR